MVEEIEKLYRKYGQDIYRYLISLSSDPSLSEDLLSETFLRAIGGIKGFKGDSSIKTWLFSIARYTYYDYLRKNKKDLSFDEDLVSLVSRNLELDYIDRSIGERILELLDEKGEREKTVVLMRVQAYSYEEIAEKLSISANSARVINFRTREAIKLALKKEGYYD